MSARVLVVLAEGAEEMEVTIAVDVLRRAGVEVLLAGLDGVEPVTCSRRMKIVPDGALAEARGPFDAVVLPGGAEGARRLCASQAVGEILREHERHGRIVGAICAAPTALAAHHVFEGKRMTSHPSVRSLVEMHGTWVPAPAVADGPLVTSMGPGTAFQFALALVGLLCGDDKVSEIRPPMILDGEIVRG